MPQIYTVQELTAYIRHILENDDHLQAIEVSGEVSNLTYHRSGHVYFVLKDEMSQLTCVMFRSAAQKADRINEGDQITLTGNITVYPPRGNYQMIVQAVRKAGKGNLFEQFLILKEKLRGEGLFDSSSKKAIPRYPEKIVLITSPTGAALRDMIRTFRRRYDQLELILVPAIVQGVNAPASLVSAIREADNLGANTIILARGGGSLEDLWGFNDERVVRAVFACDTPLISGVGHETDITLVDFVSDLRASTPTAAAEVSVPDKSALTQSLNDYAGLLQRNLMHYITFKQQLLDDYSYRLEQIIRDQIRQSRHQLSLYEAQLSANDIRRLLSQGYTLTLKDKQIQRSAANLKVGDMIETIFEDGNVLSEIQEE